MFLRVEFLDSSNNVMKTFYPESIYLQYVYRNYDLSKRLFGVEGLSSDLNYNASVLDAGATQIYTIEIPSWFNSASPKLRTLKDRDYIRTYFQSLGASAPVNTIITNFNLITSGVLSKMITLLTLII